MLVDYPAPLGSEVISIQSRYDSYGTGSNETSCADVMITLCSVTLRVLNPSDVTLRVVVWLGK